MSEWAYEMQRRYDRDGHSGVGGCATPPPSDSQYSMHGTPMGDGVGTPIANSGRTKEQFHRFAGLGVGLASVVTEHVLSHPCIVLRRQCQVHHDATWLHLTPFTLFQTIFNIQRHQSVTTLWKGIGSTLMVKGVGVATESVISEVTPLPKEVNRHSVPKKYLEHILLKGLTFVVITPLYVASLVESVQSEIASERPGVFDCFREGGARLLSLASPQSSRLLPVWRLFVPTVSFSLVHYVISSLAKYTVLVSVHDDMKESTTRQDPAVDRSLYEMYYPELLATFTGQLLADMVLYPMETILHRLYLQGTRTIIDNTDTGLGVVPIITRYEGARDCFWGILSEEGVGGFYKGFGALVLQYTLHALVLKLTKLLFERLATPLPPPPTYIPVNQQRTFVANSTDGLSQTERMGPVNYNQHYRDIDPRYNIYN